METKKNGALEALEDLSYLIGEKRKDYRSDEAALGPFVCPSANVDLLKSANEPVKTAKLQEEHLLLQYHIRKLT